MRIADFSIRRPVFAVMLISALVGLGAISIGRLGVDLFPRVEFPYMAVTTVLQAPIRRRSRVRSPTSWKTT